MIATTHSNESLSGKLGGIVAQYHDNAPYAPKSYPPHRQIFSALAVRRGGAIKTGRRLDTLLRASHSAWLALDPDRRWWIDNGLLGSDSVNCFRQLRKMTGETLWTALYLLAQPRGLLAAYTSAYYLSISGWHPARYRSIAAARQPNGDVLLGISLFIPDYWGSLGEPSHVLIDISSDGRNSCNRYRGAYPDKHAVSCVGWSGRDDTHQVTITPSVPVAAGSKLRVRLSIISAELASGWEPALAYVYHRHLYTGSLDLRQD